MTEATVNIIRSIIDAMSPQSDIYSITETATGSKVWEVNFCSPLWVRPKTIVTIGAVEYTVLSINYTTKVFTVASNDAPVGEYFTIPKPFYFHGTPENVNKHLITIKLAWLKFPMIYLYENFSEKIIRDEMSAIEKEADLTFCFLDEANFENWAPDDFLNLAQIPMMQLSEYFIDRLEVSPRIGVLPDANQAYPAEFNIVITRNNKKETTFTDPLSGCVLEQNVPITRQDCTC